MVNNKKILLLVGSINQGGAEFQLLSLARLLQSKGHHIEVLALTDYHYFLPYIQKHNIKYSCITNEGNNFQKLGRAVKQIQQKNPDLVISYIKRVSQVAILARVLSVFKFKLIISERTSLVKPLHDLYYFNLALLANKLTVNSVSKLAYIKKRFPLLRSRTVFVTNIIDSKKFEAVGHDKLTGNPLRVSFVGRISPEKNCINLVRAIRIIIDKGYKVELSLIGAASNKKYFESVIALVNDLSLQNFVKYRGPSEDVTEVYRNTDLICLVSFIEGFSNVLSEAIACGIPVIASNIDENRILVEDGKNGFLIEPHDSESIAAGLEKFLQLSQPEIDAISSNNRLKAKAIFDEEHIYQQYVDLFRQIGVLQKG